MDDWTTFRLDGDALASLGGPAASGPTGRGETV
jgi:hypothetical protein